MRQLTRIHRFHDRIALLLRGYDTHGNAVESETTYLSADEARELAWALRELARALIDFAQENIMQMNLQTYADAFEWAERPTSGERYCKLRNGAPDWIDVQAIHAALDAILPDDWIYQHAKLVADALTEYDWQDGTDESDRVHEVADGLVDFSTTALLEWLKASWARELYQEGRGEFGAIERAGDASNLEEDIQRGQFLALERIAYEILRQCREQAS